MIDFLETSGLLIKSFDIVVLRNNKKTQTKNPKKFKQTNKNNNQICLKASILKHFKKMLTRMMFQIQ